MGKKSVKIIRYLFECLLEVFYPHSKCIICGEYSETGLCPVCKCKINRAANIDNEIISYGYYGGVLKNLVLKLKYEKNFIAAEILAGFFIEIINEYKIKADYICFVPMTKESIKKRGFNQCELLARIISEKIGIPINKCIDKVKETREQKTLRKDERRKNIEGAFKVINGGILKNRNILLIDDVTTTGSTLNECKKIIEKCNINKIYILTIAKSNI